MDGKSGFCLGNVHRSLQQDFRLRAEPVLESMVVGEPAGFKQLVGTRRDQVINLLSRLDKWLAKGEARSRRLTRSYGRRTPFGLLLRHNRIGGYVGENHSRDFGGDRLVFFGLSPDLCRDRLVSTARSRKHITEANVDDRLGYGLS